MAGSLIGFVQGYDQAAVPTRLRRRARAMARRLHRIHGPQSDGEGDMPSTMARFGSVWLRILQSISAAWLAFVRGGAVDFGHGHSNLSFGPVARATHRPAAPDRLPPPKI
jgi:hypothetical protein